MFSWLGLTNTYVPLVAPALVGTTPFYVLLYYWGFRRVPGELDVRHGGQGGLGLEPGLAERHQEIAR